MDTEENLTKGEKKILLQFERLIETEPFKKEVKRLRSLLKLPVNGIEPTKEDLKELSNTFRIPDNLPIKKPKDGHFPLRQFNIESRKIISLLPIDNLYLSSLVKRYVLFNKFFYDELEDLKRYLHAVNVCELEDAQSEFDEYAPAEDPEDFYSSFSVKAYIEMLQNKLWKYPVVVRIHPDASQRDIIEFIKKHWVEIKHYQDQYINRRKDASFKNSKTTENKKIKERNDFIYKNRHLPRKEISTLVAKTFNEYLDYGHIGKIISLENKKRKKA
jgi:hypothetical protein